MTAALDRPDKHKWIFLFALWALHGVVAFRQFATLSSEHHDFLMGLSFSMVLLGGLLLSWIVMNIFLIILMTRKSARLHALLDRLKNPVVRDVLFASGVLVVVLRIWLAVLAGLLEASGNLRYVAGAARLAPLLDLISLVSLEIILLSLFFLLREWTQFRQSMSVFLVKLLTIEAILGLAGLFIFLTDLGIAQGAAGDWSRGLPAVPLLEWQIILACLLGLGMLLFEAREKIMKPAYLDGWICAAIWLFAAGFWLSQPIIPSASALKPHEPNFEIYPFIDAQVYDEYAQSVLIGNGFGADQIPQRPLYVVFLVFAHVLVGQDYRNVIALQSLALAFFPVLLYLFGREFFGRPVGVAIALLAILRDYTSNIVAPFTGNLSYSKLYLSELPTAMLLVLFLLIAVRWVRAGFPSFSGFLMGGILGVAMLVRTQVVVALPVILFFAILVEPKKIAHITKAALFACIAILIVIAPWLWRNWNMTGHLIFDNPESQVANLALRYGRLNGHEPDITPLPGESSSDYADRLKRMASDAVSANPWGVAKGVANSFLNHGVNNILIFPLRNDLQDLGEAWAPRDAFWEEWEGRPSFPQAMLLAFYIFLFGLGVTTAWVRNGRLAFLPLALNLIYNFWTSLALLSGQRFMLAMDWSIYLYYMIGLLALLGGFLFALESGRATIIAWVRSNPFLTSQPAPMRRWPHYILAGALLFGIGILLPLSEAVFPERYPAVSRDAIIQRLTSSQALRQLQVTSTCLQEVTNANQLRVVQGRVLYPRYYRSGDGESTDAAGYKIVKEGRLVFDMVGQINGRIIFPMSHSPDFFPNATHATLFLDSSGQPWFVFVQQGDVAKFYVSQAADLPVCASQ